jgi:hypothetical protein
MAKDMRTYLQFEVQMASWLTTPEISTGPATGFGGAVTGKFANFTLSPQAMI